MTPQRSGGCASGAGMGVEGLMMSLFGKRGVRCDWCGRFANNRNGEYQRQETNEHGIRLAGYIRQPEWEIRPGGDHTAHSIQSSNDICEECADKFCPFCGSDGIVNQTPTIPGPYGWGRRCKACGKSWPWLLSEVRQGE